MEPTTTYEQRGTSVEFISGDIHDVNIELATQVKIEPAGDNGNLESLTLLKDETAGRDQQKVTFEPDNRCAEILEPQNSVKIGLTETFGRLEALTTLKTEPADDYIVDSSIIDVDSDDDTQAMPKKVTTATECIDIGSSDDEVITVDPDYSEDDIQITKDLDLSDYEPIYAEDDDENLDTSDDEEETDPGTSDVEEEADPGTSDVEEEADPGTSDDEEPVTRNVEDALKTALGQTCVQLRRNAKKKVFQEHENRVKTSRMTVTEEPTLREKDGSIIIVKERDDGTEVTVAATLNKAAHGDDVDNTGRNGSFSVSLPKYFYMCCLCEYLSDSLFSFTKHLIHVHSGTTAYRQSPDFFKSPEFLKVFVKIDQETSIPAYSCGICFCNLYDLKTMKEHLRGHSKFDEERRTSTENQSRLTPHSSNLEMIAPPVKRNKKHKATMLQNEMSGEHNLTMLQDEINGERSTTVLQDEMSGERNSTMLQDEMSGERNSTMLQDEMSGERNSTMLQDEMSGERNSTVLQNEISGEHNSTVLQDEMSGERNSTMLQDEINGEHSTTILQNEMSGEYSSTMLQDKVNGECSTTMLQDRMNRECNLAMLQDTMSGECNATMLQDTMIGECNLTMVQNPISAEVLVSRAESVVDLDTQIKCYKCEARFKFLHDMYSHVREVHRTTFTCDFCGKVYKEKRYLGLHMESHIEGSGETCEICNKKLRGKLSLKKHMNSHRKTTKTVHKPAVKIVCDECGMEVRSSNMRVHKEKHKGKRYECKKCDKNFSTPLTLSNHMAVHSDVAKYVCDVCGKGFKFPSPYFAHKRIHTGAKPYKCKICGDNFRFHGNLSTHLRTHTGDPKYTCSDCGKGFVHFATYKKHVEDHG